MKNSPISDASRWAALVLSVSAPANSFRSSRPSRTLVSLGGCGPARPRCRRWNLVQQRLAVGKLCRVGHFPARWHHIAEAAGGVSDAARFQRRRRWRRVGVGRRRRRRVGVGRRRWRRVGIGRWRWCRSRRLGRRRRHPGTCCRDGGGGGGGVGRIGIGRRQRQHHHGGTGQRRDRERLRAALAVFEISRPADPWGRNYRVTAVTQVRVAQIVPS